MFSDGRVKTSSLNMGLRNYMVSVYNLMVFGLVITGVTAYLVANVPAVFAMVFGNPVLRMLFMFAPLGVVFYMGSRIGQLQVSTARSLFFAYAVLMGISLSSIFVVYTGASITRVFFISASTFLAMSIYGYSTKNDLLKFSSFLFMGIVGVVVASIVNLFMQSSALMYALSIITVLLFTGLTAYDSQKIKMMYFSADSSSVMQKKAIFGALNLYIDFLNIFISLLHLLGDRK